MGSGKQVLCPNGPGQADSYFLGEGLPYNLGVLFCFVFFLPSCDWIKHSYCLGKRRGPEQKAWGAGAAGWGWGVGSEGGMQLRVGPGLTSLRLYRLL